MKLHCDECGKDVGDYIEGNELIGHVVFTSRVSLPDIICTDCVLLVPSITFNKGI